MLRDARQMEPLQQVYAADFGDQMRLVVSQSEDRVLARVFRTTKKAAWVKVWEGRDSFTVEEAKALAQGAARNFLIARSLEVPTNPPIWNCYEDSAC